jgi:XTP/dITP diphosphohydrolase
MKVVLATRNQHKVSEILQIWGEIPFEVLTLDHFPNMPAFIEDGNSFAENALKKARMVAQKTQLVSIADDSGLEVEVLNKRPGIFSARYAGLHASDRDNLQKVLRELREFKERRACFRCVAALVDPLGYETTMEGVLEGMICEQPLGKNGFGYDPIFVIPTLEKTLAQISSEEKNQISHRAQAFRQIKEVLLHKIRTREYPSSLSD